MEGCEIEQSHSTNNQSRKNGFWFLLCAVILVRIVLIGTSLYRAHIKCDCILGGASRAQMRSFETALMVYKLRFKEYPINLEGLLEPPSGESLLSEKTVPRDSWDHEFLYISDSKNDYEIICLGADGELGGEGYASDFSTNAYPKCTKWTHLTTKKFAESLNPF